MRDLADATPPGAVTDVTRRYLASLPSVLGLDTAAGRLLLCHGVGTNDMALLGPDDHGCALVSRVELQSILAAGELPIMVGGHSHRRMVHRIGELTVINPGTLYRRFEPGFAIVDFEARSVRFFDRSTRSTSRREA